MIVMCIHSVSGLLGYASLSLSSDLPSLSAGPVVLLKTCGMMLAHAVRGIVTAASISLVEELLFRSWLPEEAAVDLGYYHAIIISGVAFSMVDGSLPSVPGLFLLSLALFGIKQRAHGKLSVPIGLRTGIIATNFTLQSGGFIKYQPSTPFWLASLHPMHPFDGAVGLSVCVILAILFFPQQPPKEETTRVVSE